MSKNKNANGNDVHDIPEEDAELSAEEMDAELGGGDDDVSEEIAAQLEELENRAADFEDKYRRSLADFQNFQRRAAINERESKEEGRRKVVEDLIPVLDTVDLAMEQDSENMTVLQIAQGFDAIRRQMMEVLGSHGVTKVTVEIGEPFVPGRHEAVMQQEAEGVPAGHVSAFLQAGYAIGDRVVRAAKVAVAPGS